MHLWQPLPYFGGECSKRTWVYGIAHSVAVSFSVRRQRRREDAF
jgi:DNA-directed RNA polymerase specialized sigma24 family protein